MGFRLLYIMIFPFRLTQTETGIAVQRERSVFAWGVTCMLPETFGGLRTRLFVYAAAGPLANLLPALIISIYLPLNPDIATWSTFLLGTFAHLSFAIGVPNLIPVQLGGMQSDGFRMLRTWSAREKFERSFAMIRLSAQLQTGTRPREFDAEALKAALALDDNSGEAIGARLLAYASSADAEDPSNAARHLEAALSKSARLGNAARKHLMREAAVFQAWYREDAGKTLYWSKQVGALRFCAPVIRARQEIAVLWGTGERQKALEKLGQSFGLINKLPNNPGKKLIERSFSEWKEKMLERLSKPPVP